MFWLLDRARGARIRRHYDDVQATMSGKPPDEGVLRDLLEHATRTTSFYESFTNLELGDFPVVDRSVIKRDQGRFRSSTFEGARLHQRRTSGSTSTPFSVVQDPDKRRRTNAEIIYFNQTAGLRVGDRLMWIRSAQLLPVSRRQRIIQNVIPVDHLGLDDLRREQIVELLRREQVDGIVSPSSALDSLARYIEARGYPSDQFGVRAIISIAENLPPASRRRIETAFGCPVTNRYSNQENGALACSKPGGEPLYLNRASYRFEFLQPQRNEPQAPGRLARVVVTDLFNRAMPMIRYDTGDLAIVGDVDDAGLAMNLATVEGRAIDVIYDASGGAVSSAWASDVMSKVFPDILQFQLTQDAAASYRLKVVLGDASYSVSDLVAELQKWLGTTARISVEFVDTIPSLASGKQRPVIREYVPGAASPPPD